MPRPTFIEVVEPVGDGDVVTAALPVVDGEIDVVEGLAVVVDELEEGLAAEMLKKRDVNPESVTAKPGPQKRKKTG